MSDLATGDALKVPVSSHDIFSVSFADIASGLALTLPEVASMALADPPQLAMHTGGEAVAFLADAEAERILFYGWPVRLPYTKTNVFWIEAGEGLRMLRMDPTLESVSSDLLFFGTRSFEKDTNLMFHHDVVRDDLYYWDIFTVHADSPSHERSYEILLDDYRGSDLGVAIHLIGWNDTPNDPDHWAKISFNGVEIGSFTFDGKHEVSTNFSVDESLVSVTNHLTLAAQLQEGHTLSRFMLDSFDISYQRHYEPSDILFIADDGGHDRLSASRFDDPVVLDVTNPRLPAWIADDTGDLPAGSSWPVVEGSDWAMRERAQIVALTPYPGGAGEWLLADTNAVDYLVVAPGAFEVPARELAEYRKGMGLRVAVALYEDVCDQFAHGLNTPEAIRNLLVYAREQWAVAPWMVVLAGRGHIDYLGVITTEPNPLPAMLSGTPGGLRAVDGLIVDVHNDDGVPDIAVGRIPARTAAQLDKYIAKLKAYEAAGPGSSQERAAFVADDKDEGGDFTATNLLLADEAAARYEVEHASLDWDSVAVVRQAVREAFTGGSGMIHYTGHGGMSQLAEENLLHVNDVNTLENIPVPLFISLTCLIARFDHPTSVSLGEALVLRQDGGAMTVYAPSGLSWNYYGEQFGKEYHRLHAVDRADTIGPTLLHARRSFGEVSGLFADSLETYNLLGDPALKLRGGEGGTPPAWVTKTAHWRWERFSYDELVDPANNLEAIEALRNPPQRGTVIRFR